MPDQVEGDRESETPAVGQGWGMGLERERENCTKQTWRKCFQFSNFICTLGLHVISGKRTGRVDG